MLNALVSASAIRLPAAIHCIAEALSLLVFLVGLGGLLIGLR